MDLDDLKTEWARRDRQLVDALRLNARLAQDTLAMQHQDRIRRAGAMGWFGMAFWILFLIGFGAFTAHHVGEWKFFLPGAALQIWTIVMGVLTIREREALREVDFGLPPVEIQARLARLRLQRARTFLWAFLTGQILWWVPFVIVLFKGLLGVDLYRASPFMPGFIAWNLVAGVAFIPAALLIGRWLRPRVAGTRLSNTVLNMLTGADLAEARAALGRIARFQQEMPA